MVIESTTNKDVPKTNGVSNGLLVDYEDHAALYGWPTTNENGYTINEVPSGTGRKLKIICVGAGASGINLVKFVEDQLKDVEVVAYDKNKGIGGTWFENRYPCVLTTRLLLVA